MDYKNIFIKNGLISIEEFFYYMQNKFEYGWIESWQVGIGGFFVPVITSGSWTVDSDWSSEMGG